MFSLLSDIEIFLLVWVWTEKRQRICSRSDIFKTNRKTMSEILKAPEPVPYSKVLRIKPHFLTGVLTDTSVSVYVKCRIDKRICESQNVSIYTVFLYGATVPVTKELTIKDIKEHSLSLTSMFSIEKYQHLNVWAYAPTHMRPFPPTCNAHVVSWSSRSPVFLTFIHSSVFLYLLNPGS